MIHRPLDLRCGLTTDIRSFYPEEEALSLGATLGADRRRLRPGCLSGRSVGQQEGREETDAHREEWPNKRKKKTVQSEDHGGRPVGTPPT
jgi:hypothetical protein